jgi:hypothetical protein
MLEERLCPAGVTGCKLSNINPLVQLPAYMVIICLPLSLLGSMPDDIRCLPCATSSLARLYAA